MPPSFLTMEVPNLNGFGIAAVVNAENGIPRTETLRLVCSSPKLRLLQGNIPTNRERCGSIPRAPQAVHVRFKAMNDGCCARIAHVSVQLSSRGCPGLPGFV
jgi:hypothetical protein